MAVNLSEPRQNFFDLGGVALHTNGEEELPGLVQGLASLFDIVALQEEIAVSRKGVGPLGVTADYLEEVDRPYKRLVGFPDAFLAKCGVKDGFGVDLSSCEFSIGKEGLRVELFGDGEGLGDSLKSKRPIGLFGGLVSEVSQDIEEHPLLVDLAGDFPGF